MKSLYKISDKITEDEYRNDGKFHYSTLAKFSRSGFHGLNTLFDRVESPSLLLGSIVDTIITDGQEAFDNQYLVAEFPDCPDSVINIVKGLFGVYKDTYNSLTDIPDNIIIPITEQVKYQLNWKDTTRCKVIKEKGADYYRLLYLSQDKQLVSNEMYANAMKMVEALRTSPATSFLFAPNNPFEPEIERHYQLKFHETFEGIDFSCMADEIMVLHDKKLVIPIDLKTSSHTEDEFYKSFIDWDYQIQARSYWRQIRATMDKDDYFKDFELANYHFVVVNKITLTPLVWECPFTKEYGSIFVGKNKQIELRDPFEIAKELKYYLDKQPRVPQGINIDKPNNLLTYLNQL